MLTLRDYQQETVTGVGDAFRRKFTAPIACAPTGGGKTVIAAHIMAALALRGWRILFLAHREELITQASKKLRDYGVSHGIIMSDWQPDRRHNVQVASVATMIKRLDRYDDFDLIVIDEAHRSGAPSYAAIVEHYQKRALAAGRVLRLLGLTATPHRLDGKGLGRHCGGLWDLIIPTRTTRQLINESYLCKYRFFHGNPIDTHGEKPKGADWTDAQAEAFMDTPELNGNIVDHYNEFGTGRPGIVFARSIRHAEKIAERFRECGRRAVAVSGESDKNLRGNVLDDLAGHNLDIVVNVGLWIEGMDCPAISYVALAALTESLTRYLQSVGRGFRLCDGKDDLIVMDHANLHAKHGYPCIWRAWSLDGRMRTADQDEASYAVKRCPQCGTLCTGFTKICDGLLLDGTVCGARFAPRAFASAPRESEDRLSEADLQQAIEQSQMMEARDRIERERAAARSSEELAAFAAKQGYKPGYAKHVEQARLERKDLERRLAELRILQGDPVSGIGQMKPKQIRGEIEERLAKQALLDEQEVW